LVYRNATRSAPWMLPGGCVPAHPLTSQCLAMSLDTHLLAHVQDRTARAARTAPRTDMFPKRHQEAVDLYPVLLWEHSFECGHGLFWGLLVHISPAVGDAVDVNVDANTWLPTPYAQHEVGAFGTNAAERA